MTAALRDKPTATALAPSMLVARATQLAADSIGSIDQQVKNVQSIHVDGSVLPGLAGDLGALNQATAQWPQTIRGDCINALQLAVSTDDSLSGQWSSVAKDSQDGLMSFARILQSGVRLENTAVTKTNAAIAPFENAVDQAVSRLQGDVGQLHARLQAEQQVADGLRRRVDAERAKIEDYKEHPWKLILAGLSLPTLIITLNDLISSMNEANKALSDLRRVEDQMGQLSAAQGPLLSLSLAVTGLSGGISNVQTALSQMEAKIGSILTQPPEPAILSAQLGAMVEDLESSRSIAQEVLAGS